MYLTAEYTPDAQVQWSYDEDDDGGTEGIYDQGAIETTAIENKAVKK